MSWDNLRESKSGTTVFKLTDADILTSKSIGNTITLRTVPGKISTTNYVAKYMGEEHKSNNKFNAVQIKIESAEISNRIFKALTTLMHY